MREEGMAGGTEGGREGRKREKRNIFNDHDNW